MFYKNLSIRSFVYFVLLTFILYDIIDIDKEKLLKFSLPCGDFTWIGINDIASEAKLVYDSDKKGSNLVPGKHRLVILSRIMLEMMIVLKCSTAQQPVGTIVFTPI